MPQGNCFFYGYFGVRTKGAIPGHNTVFQAEIQAVTEFVNYIKAVTIFTDIQKAINYLRNKTEKSKTV